MIVHTVHQVGENRYLALAVSDRGVPYSYEGVGPRAKDKMLSALHEFADAVRPGARGCKVVRMTGDDYAVQAQTLKEHELMA
jgi:hypothetical protein